MADHSFQQTREEMARREVGHTNVGRGIAWVLAIQFLLLVVGVPFIEIAYDLSQTRATDTLGRRLARVVQAVLTPMPTEGSNVSRILARNRAVISELEQFEDGSEDASRLGRWLRPETQYALAGLGAGNEQVYIGHRPWLFYRQSLDYLTGPAVQTEAQSAILHLKEQLDARGVRLIVMPAPVKLSIHPEYFTRRFRGEEGPLRPEWFPTFVRQLESQGVLVFDAAPVLVEAKRQAPQYLMTDTHWRPEAGELVAAALRDLVSQQVNLPVMPSAGYLGEESEVTNLGDIAHLLDLPEGQTRYPEEIVRLRKIGTADGAPWQPSRLGDVLLLGDSFSNIYSQGEMGWGESAGFVAQLSFLMQRPVDAIIQNADGAFATREALAQQLGRGEDRLAGKRLVIFQFAERELAVGDWKRIDLAPSEAPARRFFVPGSGEEVTVSGIIREIAPIPRPDTVPYEDHITAVHLVNLTSEREGVSGEALVYIWGMRDRVLQEAAGFRAGDRITVRLRPWSEVASQYDGISRSDLENEDAQFQEPTWGEVLN